MTATMPSTTNKTTEGRVVAIAGPVIDVEFPRGHLPELNRALEFVVDVDGKPNVILAEVAQQLGHSRVRAVCMKPTDGLRRGTPVRDTGRGICVPVGERPWVTCGTFGAKCWMAITTISKMSSAGISIVRLRHSTRSNPRCACSKPASRSSTCLRPIWLVAKSVSSVVQA